MGWSEFLFLGIGLGLGLGVHNVSKSKPLSSQPTTASSDAQEAVQVHLQALSNQLKQTQAAYQMAVEMGHFKGGFLARTSHELRSPLNSMIGMLQLILTDLCESPEEEREFAQHAYDSALKVVGLLDEIVDVAKTEHGTEKMKIQSLQLSKLLKEVESLTYLQAANRSIKLMIESVNPEIYILADLPRIRQVLVSLIDTAITEMEEGKIRVLTTITPESGYANIWIDDQRPISAWSESWELLQSTLARNHPSPPTLDHSEVNLESDFQLSPGMRLFMNQILVGVMNGSLEVLAVPTEENTANFTRTQCSLPLDPSVKLSKS
ncbi:MAG: sensor histidine kinase [Microcoleaceae cyanobacterium]